MLLKERLQDYTRSEFIQFLNLIWAVDTRAADHEQMILHFDRLTESLQGADLLFYPDASEGFYVVQESEAALALIDVWHRRRRLPTFRDDAVPAAPPPYNARSDAEQALERTRRSGLELEHRHRAVQVALDTFESMLGLQSSPGTSPLAAQAMFTQASRALDALEQARRTVIDTLNAHRFQGERVGAQIEALQRGPVRADVKDIHEAQLQLGRGFHQHYQVHRPLFEQRQGVLTQQARSVFAHRVQGLLRVARDAQAGPLEDALTFFVPLAGADLHPRLFALDPVRFKSMESHRHLVGRSIRSAAAGLDWEVEQIGQTLQALAVAFMDRQPGCGDPLALSVPLRDLLPVEGLDVHERTRLHLPQRLGFAIQPLRVGMRIWDGLEEITEQAYIQAIRSADGTAGSEVRVRPAVWDETMESWKLDCSDGRHREVVWCNPARWTRIAQAPEAALRDNSFSTVRVPLVTALDPGPLVLDDYIVVFPRASGIEPIYVTFKPRTLYPGMAFGQGREVSSDWLARGSRPHAVPAQVARLLGGRVFDRFEHWLAAFCKAVAGFPELRAAFSAQDLIRLAQGQIPNGTGRFTIEFRQSPLEGGEVYDMDNLLVTRHS